MRFLGARTIALSAEAIAEQTGFKDEERTFYNHRKAIRMLRFDGYPIVSGPKGFWRTRSTKELAQYAESLKNRAGQIMETRRAILDIIKERKAKRTKNSSGRGRVISIRKAKKRTRRAAAYA